MADLIPIPMGIPWDPWDPSFLHFYAHLYQGAIRGRARITILAEGIIADMTMGIEFLMRVGIM